jgi:two-component system chemotaxis response regulator CheB
MAIRVLVVDDSPFVCRLLTSHLQSSPDFEVVGTALNGLRAIELAAELKPDVVTLDLEMPQMDGLAALQQIMVSQPTPVVMISGVSRKAAQITLQALESGAVDFILKYTPGVDTEPEALRKEILSKVRSASKIKVVRSLRPFQIGEKRPLPVGLGRSTREQIELRPALEQTLPYLPGGVVVIGASTGGPVAVRELLSRIPAHFPAAIIVVQHIPASFTPVLAAQLERSVPLKVKEARPGDKLIPGQVLIAPGDYHLLIGPDSRVILNQGPKIKGHRPSVDVTMQAVAQVYGARTSGVVLTGMGDDGSLGLLAIHAKGGKTYVQDEATCVVNGMPQRAIEKGVVDYVAPPPQIAEMLVS